MRALLSLPNGKQGKLWLKSGDRGKRRLQLDRTKGGASNGKIMAVYRCFSAAHQSTSSLLGISTRCMMGNNNNLRES